MPTHVNSQGRVGPAYASDGVDEQIGLTRSLAQTVADRHGRFYEANFRGSLFSAGMTMTSISNATYTVGTLTNAVTPVVGVWNPSTSLVNLVMLQAVLQVSQTALQATGCGGFVWASSVGNTAISTGSAPLNRKTLVLAGSSAKDLTNTTPTGLTNNLVVRHAAALGGGSAIGTAFLATQVAAQTQAVVFTENIDGGIIVPPGGFLALLATITPVGHSAASSLLWEEIPV